MVKILRNEKRPIDRKRFYKNSPKTLGKELNGFHRVMISKLIKETAKAYQVMINTDVVWLPKSQVKLGLHPSHSSQAVDIPNWLFNRI